MQNDSINKNRGLMYWGIIILAAIVLLTVAAAFIGKSKYSEEVDRVLGLTTEEKARILNASDPNAVPVVLSDNELNEILNEESNQEPVILTDEEERQILNQ